MVIAGTVVNGQIVLDQAPAFPDGTRVVVEISPRSERAEKTGGSANETTEPSFVTLLAFAGLVKDLPPDMARNHDHYLHGAPKK